MMSAGMSDVATLLFSYTYILLEFMEFINNNSKYNI